MGLEEDVTRLFHAMMMNELRFMRRFGTDISYQSIFYLDLARYSEGSTVGSLAATLSLDKSTVSRKVDSLVEKGLLVKERDPDDGRVMRLRLGESVERLYDAVDGPYYRAADRLREELTDDERRAVLRAVTILTEELERGSDDV